MFRLPTDLAEHLARGGTLLVPTRQRVRAVQLAYAAAALGRGEQVWASPDVLTPSGYLRRECERRAEDDPRQWARLLSPAEEWVLWRQAAREASRGYVFLDDGALAASLQRSSELAADYGILVAAASEGSEAAVFYQAQRLFNARCRELNAASVSALAPRLAEAPRPEAAASVLLRGFGVPPACLAQLAAARAPRAAPAPPPPALVMPQVLIPQDAQAELEAIAAWCRSRLRAQPDARLLVMLPGSAGSRERLAALIREALDPAESLSTFGDGRRLVGIEGGQPFAQLPLPAQALLGLAVLGGDEMAFDSISQWLTAPFWLKPLAPQRAALALMLRQRSLTGLNLRELLGALQLAPPELKPAARELDALLRQAAGLLGEAHASPRRWSERFDAALAALTWPGPVAAASVVQQTRLRWRELLEEFGELAASVGTLRRDAALELLRALALRTAYRAADEDVPVMISPAFADPVVRYDGLWVGSLSADALPQPVAPDPFLPLQAQIQARVPHSNGEARRTQALALLEAWRAGAEDLLLSVPAREKDLELLPSPLLAGFALRDCPPGEGWLPLQLHRGGLTESLSDPSGARWNPLTPLPSGTRALTLQNACPFRAYAELRLGALPPEIAEPGVPMDQRGLLLHAALQTVWERLQDSRALGALDEPGLAALIRESVAQAAQALQAQGRGRRRRTRRDHEGQFDLFTVLSPALARECRRAERLIARLCALERTRAPFRVEATEQVAELALAGGRVRMRLDRIDSIAEGRVILDYKSGRPGSPDWFGARPTHPQLLAYLAALGSDVIALATVNVTAREVRFCGVAAAAGLLPQVKALPAGEAEAREDWSAQQAAWQERIAQLIREFLAGDARVDPAPGACEYCHVTDICRIGAHRAPPAETAGAEDADE